MASDDFIEFCLLSPGTLVSEPNEEHVIEIRFPDADAAIIFHEFLRAHVAGELDIEVFEPEN